MERNFRHLMQPILTMFWLNKNASQLSRLSVEELLFELQIIIKQTYFNAMALAIEQRLYLISDKGRLCKVLIEYASPAYYLSWIRQSGSSLKIDIGFSSNISKMF